MSNLSVKPKVLYFVTEDWYFVSHRLLLAKAARDSGYDVCVVTNVNDHGENITNAGLNLFPINLSRSSVNLFKELSVICRLISIYKSEKPDIVHHVALKPVLYGTIAAFFSKVPFVVNALAGLGSLFSSQSIKLRFLRPFVKFVFRRLLNRKNSRVILQNPDDVQLMCNSVLHRDRVALIRSSGVDTSQFVVLPEPVGDPIVILASRLLWDKGVAEFVDAARQLRQQGIKARFILIGSGDVANPSAISDDQLRRWSDGGDVEWWGHRDNMAGIIAESHIVCLPSYYGEGVPKVLIEAASCGRPVVTTDMPGCREIVHDGVNGFLVPARNADAVAEALEEMIRSPGLRQQFGVAGRKLVERDFAVGKVNFETLKVYERLLLHCKRK